jgi:hypothetical protein
MRHVILLLALAAVPAVGCAPEQERLDLTQVSAPLDARLGQEARILGRVIDAEGNPVTGVVVTASGGQTATTDAGGAFTIGGIVAADAYHLAVSAEGHGLPGSNLTPEPGLSLSCQPGTDTQVATSDVLGRGRSPTWGLP